MMIMIIVVTRTTIMARLVKPASTMLLGKPIQNTCC